jgi:hypothetical protein
LPLGYWKHAHNPWSWPNTIFCKHWSHRFLPTAQTTSHFHLFVPFHPQSHDKTFCDAREC